MTKQEAIEFAVSSARMAVNAWDDYGSLQNSIEAHRDNIRDTLNEYKCSEYEAAAWAVFDAKVTQMRA